MTDGRVTRDTTGADLIMVISHTPVVLGGLPPDEDTSNYEKVAFMGQVPAKIVGAVRPGDYVLPSGRHDGLERASIDKQDIELELLRKEGDVIRLPARALSESDVYLASQDIEVTRTNRLEALRHLSDVLATRVVDHVEFLSAPRAESTTAPAGGTGG